MVVVGELVVNFVGCLMFGEIVELICCVWLFVGLDIGVMYVVVVCGMLMFVLFGLFNLVCWGLWFVNWFVYDELWVLCGLV